jgi:aryl-alcohol dehydrogenase-like predicted oxidoreductase
MMDQTFFSFHPSFLEQELTRSLQRLRTPYLDSYLVHNPETILHQEIAVDLPEEEIEKHREKAVDKLNQRLTEVIQNHPKF